MSKVYRGKNLGLRLIGILKELAAAHACYKIILDCSEDTVPFYEKCGLVPKERQMVLYFKK